MDAIHDADAEGHERLGEVNNFFTLCCDGEASDCQVGFLKHRGRVQAHHVNTQSETYTERHSEHEDVTYVYDITNDLSA